MSSHVERLASGQDDQDMALQANERSLGGGCGPMFPGTRALEGGPKKMGRDARHYCGRRWSKHPTGTPIMMGGGACRRWPGGGGVEVACSSSMQTEGALAVRCRTVRVCSVQCAVCSVPFWEAWTRRAPSSAAARRRRRRPSIGTYSLQYRHLTHLTHPKGPAAAEEKGPLAPFNHHQRAPRGAEHGPTRLHHSARALVHTRPARPSLSSVDYICM
jgi:hypothetical protein